MEIRGGAGAEGEQSLGVSMELPFLTVALRPTQGKIRVTPEDFRVDELPAYEPSGEGEHLFVRFEKTNLATHEAVGQIARALDVSPRDASVAGLKDKRAVTTQWACFFHGDADRARSLDLNGIRVLEAARHGNKLRTGHLRGNRFVIRVRETDADVAHFETVLETLSREGAPNYYGEQRFGHGGGNLLDARAWLLGTRPPPRDKRARKFLVSVVQSSIFNRVLAERVRTGKLGEYLDGDLLKKEDSGGLFTTEDAADAALRVRDWAVSPTGPMVGPKMRWPERAALAAELAALEAEGFTLASLAAFGRDGEGPRRVLRVRPTEIHVSSPESGTVDLSFTLPSGAYATVILRETLKRDGASHTPDEPIAENDDD